METIDGVEVVTFADAAAFESWLEQHHQRPEGVWIKVAKKRSGIPSITSDEAVDVGLCFGWISGQRRSYDAQYYLQKYVPRRPKSVWSKVNAAKVERLLAAGRMREPGLAEVRAAQADGRWVAAYASQKDAAVPPELAAALAAKPRAKAAFDALDKTARYVAFLPILQASSPQARATRLARLLATLEGRDRTEPA